MKKMWELRFYSGKLDTLLAPIVLCTFSNSVWFGLVLLYMIHNENTIYPPILLLAEN